MTDDVIKQLRRLHEEAGNILPLRQGNVERYHVFTDRDAEFCPAAGRVLLRMNEHFRHESEAALIVAAVNALPALLDAAERVREAEREIVICSAIRLPDGRIFRGHRHGDCIRTASELVDHQHNIGLVPEPWTASMCRDQGFITSRNRYVGREEALQLQLAAGIESVCPSGYRRSQLFSEDLY